MLTDAADAGPGAPVSPPPRSQVKRRNALRARAQVAGHPGGDAGRGPGRRAPRTQSASAGLVAVHVFLGPGFQKAE